MSAKAERGELLPASRLTFADLAETWIDNFAALVAAGERGNARSRTTATSSTAFVAGARRKRLQEITPTTSRS